MSAFCEVHRLVQRLPFSRSGFINCAQRTLSTWFKDSSIAWSSSHTSLRNNYSGYQLISFSPARRFKYSKSTKIEEDDSDDDDYGDDDELVEDAAYKLIKAAVPSLRIDAIVKAGLGLARNKVEVLFYENKLRLNGKKIAKKSHTAMQGDEIDVIKGFYELNPSLLEVSRVVLVSAKANSDSSDFKVRLRRYKSLPIENYEDNPWKGNNEQ